MLNRLLFIAAQSADFVCLYLLNIDIDIAIFCQYRNHIVSKPH